MLVTVHLILEAHAGDCSYLCSRSDSFGLSGLCLDLLRLLLGIHDGVTVLAYYVITFVIIIVLYLGLLTFPFRLRDDVKVGPGIPVDDFGAFCCSRICCCRGRCI